MPSIQLLRDRQEDSFLDDGSVSLSPTRRADSIVVEVYDVRGAHVRTLLRGAIAAGRHALAWDGRSDDGAAAAPGVYLVRAYGFGQASTLRVALLR